MFKYTYKVSADHLLVKVETVNINEDWQYLESNTQDFELAMQSEYWEEIKLPHTWNKWDAIDMVPGYRRDASWYKKTLEIEKDPGALYKLYFEGVNITSSIFVNGQHAHTHKGGYVGFEVDITPYLKEDNPSTEITIRVDNGYNPHIIPSQKADFFIYGGITRDVWLKTVPKINIDQVLITTPKVTWERAIVEAKIEIENKFFCDNCRIVSQIISPDGKKVLFEKSEEFKDDRSTYEMKFKNIGDPLLWSPSSPNLYTLKTFILSGSNTIHENTNRFGLRFYEFKENGPFYLNGERLLLRGTHRHEEHAGYGAAMPNELHRKDLEMIKELGANFVRLAHYPQDPEVYKACDELGLLVWDELPWCRGGLGDEEWKINTKNLLSEQIEQNYNHPSIITWSMGNEVYWLPDFPGGDNPSEINDFLKELNEIAHELDPFRPTSIRKYYDGADLVDVFSPSIWSGWYAGVYTNYEKTLDQNIQKYPRFLHMEYGGASHVGRHTETPISGTGIFNEDDWEEVSNQVGIKNIAKEGDWTENYIVDLFDWYLTVTENKDNLTGNAQWAFKDFGTPLRPENSIPYINQKGLVDRAGNPKDAYYVFKSYWSEEPVIYIESHTWTERQGPSGKSREVNVFSNCMEVELVHNGRSLGSKTRDITKYPASGLNWNILFVNGSNKLIAKGKVSDSETIADTLNINYSYKKSGKADHIDLGYHLLENGNYLVEALMKDKEGNRVLDYEKLVYFSLDGSGELMINYGTPQRSQVIEMANGRAVIEMIPGSGKAIIEARNQDFKGSYLIIDADHRDLEGETIDERFKK